MRTVSRVDLENATDYRWLFGENMPESFPGSTAVGVSRKVLTALKTKGEADLRVPEGGIAGALGSLLGGILAIVGCRLGRDDAGDAEAGRRPSPSRSR